MTRPYRAEFDSSADFLAAVVENALSSGQQCDPRLVPLSAATGLNESIPSDGGFLLPDDFRQELSAEVSDTGILLSKINRVPTSRARVTFPCIDQTSRAAGQMFGGVQAQWGNEAGSITATKPKFGAMTLPMKKIVTDWYVTGEAIEDSEALTHGLRTVAVEEITFAVEQEMISGDGTRGPLGVLKSNCLIAVAPESGQAASTLRGENLTKAMGRFWPASHRRGIWLMSLECYQQICGASFSNGAPIVQYEGGRRYILGVELFVSEHSNPLGQEGDVLLLDPKEYILADRGQELLQSVHVQFLAHESVFRLTWRLNGQLRWKGAVVPRNCTATASPAVTLAQR